MAANELEPVVVECRICHSKSLRGLILSPCLCKGSMAYVHFRCLERWLNYSSRDTCELCSYKFSVELSRRYSCWQSARVWLRHPNNRTFILCDLVIGLVLTSLTLALALVCFLGLSHFVKEGYDQGIQSFWSEGMIDFFLLILLAGYLATMYAMARDHIRPWYRWWTRCNNVRLVQDVAMVVPLEQESNDSVRSDKRLRVMKRAGRQAETSICDVCCCGVGKAVDNYVCEHATVTESEHISESVRLPISEEIIMIHPSSKTIMSNIV